MRITIKHYGMRGYGPFEFAPMWSPVYKGIEIIVFGWGLWIGYTPQEWRERGW